MLRGELQQGLLCWRPILAGKCSLAEVKAGVYSLVDLLKINALLDMQDDIQAAMLERRPK